MSIDNLQLLVKKRSHSQYPKSAPHIPKTAIPTERFAIAPHIPKSELLAAALRYRIPTSPTSELLAAALRYRTPTSPHPQNSDCSSPTSPKAIALSLHPQKAIANITKSSPNSKQNPLKHLPPTP
jgi:hypothetical protein